MLLSERLLEFEEFEGAEEGPATGVLELEGFELFGRLRGRSVRVDGGGFLEEPFTFGGEEILSPPPRHGSGKIRVAMTPVLLSDWCPSGYFDRTLRNRQDGSKAAPLSS